jgi:hypothetical protein
VINKLTLSDRFLLPTLQIEAVLDKPTVRKRRQALKGMPKALSGAFEMTFERIRGQKPDVSKQAMEIIKWTFLAKRQFSLEELRHALAVEPDDEVLHWDNFVDPKFILDCCLGLIIIDESTSTIRLVHKSLQDYLNIEYNKYRLFEEGHAEIARLCLNYMSFETYDVDLCPDSDDEIWGKYPLLDYARLFWDNHVKTAKPQDDAIEDMVISVLREKHERNWVFRGLLAWRRHSEQRVDFKFYSPRPRFEKDSEYFHYPIVHEITYLWLENVLSWLLDSKKFDINSRDFDDHTPLEIAATSGQDVLTQLLLQQEGVEKRKT